MTNLKIVFVALSLATAFGAFADETVSEKVAVAGKDAGRSIKKGAHRTSEALCMKGDLKCTGDKVKNRVIEAKDATVDGASEIKNKID
jgi:hypothetical protein